MKVAVVGAGLSGLAVAYGRARRGDTVRLFERESRTGGQLFTRRENGFVVEYGAEGFVAGSSAVPALASELGVLDELREQRIKLSYGFDGRALTALAPGDAARFLGFQVKSDELGRGVRTFERGMQSLTDALTDALTEQLPDQVSLELGRGVRALELRGSLVRMTLEDGEVSEFDAVVLASNARHASSLLAAEVGAAAEALVASETLSNVSVSLAYRARDVGHALDASGFVVALAAQEDGLRAGSFSSSKFENRAPAEHALVRLFFRPKAGELTALDDAAWVERAVRGLERIFPLHSSPLHSWVSRWDRALPVSDAAHAERVEQLEQALASRRIWLCGSAFHGSGIDAAVRSAARTIESLG
jgi:oxygen-dependent protoporphyrinogen oxidase